MLPKVSLKLLARGDDYHPSRVPFTFTRANDPSGYAGPGKPYGSSLYVTPEAAPTSNEILTFHTAFLPILPAMRQAGATQIFLRIGFVDAVMGEAMLTGQEMGLLADLGVDVMISIK